MPAFHKGVPWDCAAHPRALTVHDEVDLSGVGLVAGLEGAGVEALVAQPHLGDEDGELLRCVDEQPHPWVAGPAVVARVQDVGAVQPGHAGHVLVNETAEGGVVTFAHRVVVSGRAELQALGQQPCGQEGGEDGSAGTDAPHTRQHTFIDVARHIRQTLRADVCSSYLPRGPH